jgi:tRNA-specific 2-thiouridylase
LFPLGDFSKQQVRDLACRAGLLVHDKPDSTGICFIGERPFADFLAGYIESSPGPIEDLRGRVLGCHRGLPFYTLGQRAGLAIGGARGHAEEPWYVAAKDPARNALIVLQRHDEQHLEALAVTTEPINWLAPPRAGSFAAQVRLRHRQPEQQARIELDGSGRAQIHFERPQRAATPGQFAVLYDAGRCLGGAAVERVLLRSEARYNPAA